MAEPYGPPIESWLGDLGIDGTVRFGNRLVGATTASLVTVAPAGQPDLVVKVYDHEIDGVGPDDVARDAAAMLAAAEVGLSTPVLIDSDADGERLGWPSLIMTRLVGRPMAYGGDDAEAWVDGLASALIAIGNAPLPTLPLRNYRSWLPQTIVRPAWSSDDRLWHQIAEMLAEELPTSAPRFMHRDFHQLNVLWADGQPTGTVDWVNGCLGPIESDIATARVNIALADHRYDGLVLADRFLERCVAAELPWHPVWDLEFIAGATDRPEVFLVGTDLGPT